MYIPFLALAYDQSCHLRWRLTRVVTKLKLSNDFAYFIWHLIFKPNFLTRVATQWECPLCQACKCWPWLRDDFDSDYCDCWPTQKFSVLLSTSLPSSFLPPALSTPTCLLFCAPLRVRVSWIAADFFVSGICCCYFCLPFLCFNLIIRLFLLLQLWLLLFLLLLLLLLHTCAAWAVSQKANNFRGKLLFL